MKKTIKRVGALLQKRSTWIAILSGAALTINDLTPLVPQEYLISATVSAIIINRFLKLLKEEEAK